MNSQFQTAMREATRLTRAGRLTEATVVIQRALWQTSSDAAAYPAAVTPADTIIEGTYRVTPAHRPAAPPLLLGAPLAPRVPVAAPQPATPIPARSRSEGAFISGRYAAQNGARSYKLYIPSGDDASPRPLLVMLHGCGQDPDDFAVGTGMNQLAEEQGCLVVYPAQARSANSGGCWNWFAPADQQRGQGEPALLVGIVGQVAAQYAVDPQRIFVAGLSSGGAMAVVLGLCYPELFAAVGCHSGLAYGAAHDLLSAMGAMRRPTGPAGKTPLSPTAASGPPPPRLIVFHGDQDTTVHPDNADQLVVQWLELAPPASPRNDHGPALVKEGKEDAGTGYTRNSYPDAYGGVLVEQWRIHGAGHGWSGGRPAGSFTVPNGPDASRELLRFFLTADRTPRVL